MTDLITDTTAGYDKEFWTNAKFQDEFFLELTKPRRELKIIDGNGVTNISVHFKKYYYQTFLKMYRIPLTEQHPKSKEERIPFVIEFKDLSPIVQAEFKEYCKLYNKRQIALFLKEVVIRLFENLDYEYAHMSVMKKLRVMVIQ
jgi:hypothetical protein